MLVRTRRHSRRSEEPGAAAPAPALSGARPASATETAAPRPEGISVGELWRAVRACGMAVAILVVVGAGVGYAIGKVLPTRYESTATLYVVSPGPGPLSQLLLKSYADAAVATPVLDAAARSAGPAKASSLERAHLAATVPADTNLIRLEAVAPTPSGAGAAAAAAVAAFARYLRQSSGSNLHAATIQAPGPAELASPSPKRDAVLGAFVGLMAGIALAAVRRPRGASA
jgi:capsular polysaccharide biosynthesis protein